MTRYEHSTPHLDGDQDDPFYTYIALFHNEDARWVCTRAGVLVTLCHHAASVLRVMRDQAHHRDDIDELDECLGEVTHILDTLIDITGPVLEDQLIDLWCEGPGADLQITAHTSRGIDDILGVVEQRRHRFYAQAAAQMPELDPDLAQRAHAYQLLTEFMNPHRAHLSMLVMFDQFADMVEQARAAIGDLRDHAPQLLQDQAQEQYEAAVLLGLELSDLAASEGSCPECHHTHGTPVAMVMENHGDGMRLMPLDQDQYHEMMSTLDDQESAHAELQLYALGLTKLPQ